MPVVGFLRKSSPDDSAPLLAAFHQGLNETGFVEHHNVGIEYRWAQNRDDRLAALATDLVRHQVVAIMASGDTAAPAAKAVTSIVPIVFVTGADPIKIGVVASLNRPGDNITGIYWIGGAELEAKRAELLRELIPKAATVAYLRNPNSPSSELALSEVQTAAQALGRQIIVLTVQGERDLDAAFASLAQQRVEGLLVGADALFFSMRERIISLAERYRVPAIYQWREAAEAGGLVSYGPSITDAHRQGGTYVGRILKGENPAELPVMQSTKFELVINLKTAKTLGLDVPASFYWRADEVIE